MERGRKLQVKANNYLKYVKSHFDNFLEIGTDIYGKDKTPMWMSSVDLEEGNYPTGKKDYYKISEENNEKVLAVEERLGKLGKWAYRYIDAPHGCNLYWDQPLIQAALDLSRLTADMKYKKAAKDYIGCFLEKCVSDNGIFLWGNHYYYDAFKDKVVKFIGEPEICDMEEEKGTLHEMRPIRPVWDIFWEISPKKLENFIVEIGKRHIYDENSGGFNRHADNKKAHAFIEAGGILIETLCWLYSKTEDKTLLEKAKKIANFSWEHRNSQTGLLENNPTVERWDKYTSTTEIGLWADCLLMSYQLSGYEKFVEMAKSAVLSFIKYGYDEGIKKYYGKLKVKNGTAITGEKETKFQPEKYSNIWHRIFPSHDYPLIFAESTLKLYQITGEKKFKEAAIHWVKIIQNEIENGNYKYSYAERLGLCIRFLLKAGKILKKEDYIPYAEKVADKTISLFYHEKMFKSHPYNTLCNSLDGIGFLLQGLLHLSSEINN